MELAEEGLLMAMIKNSTAESYVLEQPNFSLVHPQYQLLFLLYDAYRKEKGNGDFDLAAFMDYVQKPELNQKLMAMDRTFGSIDVEMDAVKDYLKVIINQAPYEEQVKSLQQKISLAKSQHDDAALITLMTELINLKKEHFQQQ